MASLSLFQKWRSQNFQDLVGQEVVVRTLRNALSTGRIGHAYLFCGPRGTGKTSTARILAKALNCVHGPTPDPCGECSACRSIAAGSCLDVLEIDAASHTQVDKIREFIVEKVQFAPAEVRYKVYIIDEVHKLSSASFNALLKTLEEPPEHVVFILATTHPQELLPTILSRCQRYDFKRFTLSETSRWLGHVASSEGVEAENEALELIAKASEGSMRDALVDLEQAMTFCGSKITSEGVRDLLGLAGAEAVGELVSALLEKQTCAALEILDELVQKGRDLRKFSGELLDYLRQILLVKVRAAQADALGASESQFVTLERLSKALELPLLQSWVESITALQRRLGDSQNGHLQWELALINLTQPSLQSEPQLLAQRLGQLEEKLARLEERLLERASTPALASPGLTLAPAAAASPPPAAAPAKAAAPLPQKLPKLEEVAASVPASVPAPAAEVDLGWGQVEEPTPKKVEPPPQKVEPPPARKRPSSPGAIWKLLLEYLGERNGELQRLVAPSRCLSTVSGVITIKYKAGHQEEYRRAGERQKELEALLSERMRRPITLVLRPADKEEASDPSVDFGHTVGLVVNNFEGRVISEYANP